MELLDVVRVLDSPVRIPIYSVVGYTHERIVYLSNVGGVTSLWSLNPTVGELLRLTREPVHSVANISMRSRYVIYTRDVSKGRELQKLFAVAVDGDEKRVYADMTPMRFFGLTWDGEKLVFTAANASGMSLYLAKEGSVTKNPSIRGGRVLFESNFEGSSKLYIYDLSNDSLTEVRFRNRDYHTYSPVEDLAFGWVKAGLKALLREGRHLHLLVL